MAKVKTTDKNMLKLKGSYTAGDINKNDTGTLENCMNVPQNVKHDVII